MANLKIIYIFILGSSLVVSVVGCVTTGGNKITDKLNSDATKFTNGKTIVLQPFYRALYVEGERNSVLNFSYLGLAAMELGEYGVAEKALDSAITRIEAIYADDPNAKKAKSLWNEEKIKDFKGEPYERSMVYFYRGLLYLRIGDYQNARAMFLSAERHDTLSEKETFQSDFGIMNYLAAWASFCDGDELRAEDLFSRAVNSDPNIFSSLNYKHTYLGLIDVGESPIKVGKGSHKELLTIEPAASDVIVDSIIFNGKQLSEGEMLKVADVEFQATTRGGRPVQAILDGKATFKENTDIAADVALATSYGVMTAASSPYSYNDDLASAGAILGLIGIVAKVASTATTPEADTRYWGALPSSIFLIKDTNNGFSKQLSVEYTSSINNSKDTSGTITSVMESTNHRCGISWSRTHSAIEQAWRVDDPKSYESGRIERNVQFRALLESNYGVSSVDIGSLPKSNTIAGGSS